MKRTESKEEGGKGRSVKIREGKDDIAERERERKQDRRREKKWIGNK